MSAKRGANKIRPPSQQGGPSPRLPPGHFAPGAPSAPPRPPGAWLPGPALKPQAPQAPPAPPCCCPWCGARAAHGASRFCTACGGGLADDRRRAAAASGRPAAAAALQPAPHRSAPPQAAPPGVGHRPPRGLAAAACFDGLPPEQPPAPPGAEPEAACRRGPEQPWAPSVPPCSASSVPLRGGPGPAEPGALQRAETLAVEVRRALMAKLEASLPHGAEELREGAGQHPSAVAAPEKGPARATVQRQLHTTRGPALGPQEAPYTAGLGPAVPPPLKLIAGLPAEQRRALLARLEACLPHDLSVLCEGARRQSPGSAEASEEWPAPAACRGGHHACDLVLGTPKQLHASWPAPAAPLLHFIEGLSAEQRRALQAKLEAGLPDDLDKLRSLAEFLQ